VNEEEVTLHIKCREVQNNPTETDQKRWMQMSGGSHTAPFCKDNLDGRCIGARTLEKKKKKDNKRDRKKNNFTYGSSKSISHGSESCKIQNM